MTRSEFIEEITTWCELLDFCDQHDLEACSDVVSDSDKDDAINNALSEFVRYNDWETVYSVLEDIPCGYQYYQKNRDFDYEPLDDRNFERYKEDVIQECDDWDIWDYEDEEEEDFFEEESEVAEESEPFTIGELYTVCSGVLQSIGEEKEKREKERNASFDSFVMNFVSAEMKGK